MKWSAWKSVLAGAVIGFVEAAGPDAARQGLRRPLAVVRIDDRRHHDPLAGIGIWFLDPLPDPRPRTHDLRRASPARLLVRLDPLGLIRLVRRASSPC